LNIHHSSSKITWKNVETTNTYEIEINNRKIEKLNLIQTRHAVLIKLLQTDSTIFQQCSGEIKAATDSKVDNRVQTQAKENNC